MKLKSYKTHTYQKEIFHYLLLWLIWSANLSSYPYLDKLKVGDYSTPIVYKDEQDKQAVRVVYLQARTEPHRENMRDDYDRIAQRALEEKKDRVIEKWFQSKLPTYYVMVDKDLHQCESLKSQFPNYVSK